MEKTKIKNFAIKAREDLIRDIKNKAADYGITEDKITQPLEGSTREIKYFVQGVGVSGQELNWRNDLENELKKRSEKEDYKDAFNDLVEEIAYTWFNRIIAIRFMEVNDYLPSRTRVLSSERGSIEPDIMTDALELEDDLGTFTQEERAIIDKKRETEQAVDADKMYSMLFIKQIDALGEILPHLFEKTSDYMKLLFTPRYNQGVIKDLIETIPESYFDVSKEGQVEIIGWMYQYYNTVPKDNAFSKKGKYLTGEIPAVTQLFTPSWIVKYMVENSLGRYWINVLRTRGDKRSSQEIADAFEWKYFMPEAPENAGKFENNVDKDITEVKFIDPAMGSGHILVYAFQVFMQLYESEGYNRRNAVGLILENNLFGLDIDTRAYQLSYFALSMLGRQYDRRYFSKDYNLNLIDIPESHYQAESYSHMLEGSAVADKAKALADIDTLNQLFAAGNDLGSIIKIPADLDLKQLEDLVNSENEGTGELSFGDIDAEEYRTELKDMVEAAKLLGQSYEIAVSNPPYMGTSRMPDILKNYINKNYPNSKSDLFAVFMEKILNIVKQDGYLGMITQHSWMFLSSFESLRAIIQQKTIINMAHLGTRAFDEIGGEVVQSTAFIIKNEANKDYVGTYERLVDYSSQDTKEEAYLKIVTGENCKDLYRTNQTNFQKIPGGPIAYWASQNLIDDFVQGEKLGDIVDTKVGLQTGDNNAFLRQWYEVDINNISFDSHSIQESIESRKKWFPYNKGGSYRKWYGNYDYVVNWENDGYEIRNFKDGRGKLRSRPQNTDYYFKPAITWSDVTSGPMSHRLREECSIFDVVGMSIFDNGKSNLIDDLAFLNTNVANYIMKILNPTIHQSIGYMSLIPIRTPQTSNVHQKIAETNVKLAKKDWNSFEVATDYSKHQLLEYIDDHNRNWTLEEAYAEWEQEALDRFNQLKINEEELNRIFIDLYGLQDELTPEEDDSDVSVRKADKERDIKSFLSYFIGCVFGRYSLDVDGLAFAGGKWDDSKYSIFKPNKDNVILLTEDDYFGDERDVIYRLREFLTATFGSENLEKNMRFIADTLDEKAISKGNTADSVIRAYFNDKFYKDHLKTYQKRPIYWEMKSGRKSGFKALIYLHRYTADNFAMIRSTYLQAIQSAYSAILDQDRRMLVDATTAEKRKLDKEVKDISLKLDELITYDNDLQSVADKNIELDLDDGVVVNHKKVQGGKKILTPAK